MSPPSVRVAELPETWFDRDVYRPRLGPGPGGPWFLASSAARLFLPEPEVPSRGAIPPGVAASPEARRAALEETYETWRLSCPPAVERNLEALGREGTRAVVTGQQPGFLTGPLYTIYKAISAIALASAIERSSGTRCVPVFWVAGEDHDIDEVREARVPAAGDGEASFALPHRSERRPLDSLAVDAATEAVLADVRGHFAGRRHAEEVARLSELYRGRTVASGFGAILAELLGARGLVIADPRGLRRLAAPVLRRVLGEPQVALERIREGRERVEQAGVEPFVASRFPLFLIRDGRRDHLAWDGEAFSVGGGGPRLRADELIERLERAPSSLSSGALLRPLVQDAVLPTALTVCGPAEAGYFAQLPPLARWLGLPPPRPALRLQATLIDAKAARAMRRLDLRLEHLAAARRAEDLVPLGAEGEGIIDDAARVERSIGDLARQLREDGRFPEASRRQLERTAGKAASSFAKLRDRIDREVRRSREESYAAARVLWSRMFPSGSLQERRWNVFYYLAKYGTQWLDELIDEVERSPFSRLHRLVTFEEDDR